MVSSPRICKSRSLTVTACLAPEEMAVGKGSLSGISLCSTGYGLNGLSVYSFLRSPPTPVIHVTTAHFRKFEK